MTDDPLGAWLRETTDADARAAQVGPAPGASPAADGPAPQPRGSDTSQAPPGDDRVAALFADERLASPPRRRRRLLWLLAALPWLVVAALLLAPAAPVPTAGSGAREGPVANEVAAAAGSATSPPSDAGVAQTDAGVAQTMTTSVADDRLLAAAAVAVRTTVTASDGRTRRYVDTVAAESVVHHGDIAVVTVRAVVLDGTADRWLRARPARFAVPVAARDNDVVAMADPWVLASPPARPAVPVWRPLPDQSLAPAVAVALRDVGYRDVAQPRLSVSDDLPGIVRAGVRARAPGERAVRGHALWFSDGQPPQLLGAPPPTPAPSSAPVPPPIPTPSSAPAPSSPSDLPSPDPTPEPLEQP